MSDSSSSMIWTSENVRHVSRVSRHYGKIAAPLAVAGYTVRTASAVYDDVQNDTSRNTIETSAEVVGGFGAGTGGGAMGAAIGTMICPGAGTLIGGLVGSFSGGMAGSYGAKKLTETVADHYDYDMQTKTCRDCGKSFKVRLYRGESKKRYCPDCS